jgi:hypothetical protein
VRLVLIVALMALASPVTPPSLYVSKGACPFEGCAYREWLARRSLPVYERAGGARIIARLQKGERVQALNGEVHCRPVRVIAGRDDPAAGSYEPTSPRIRKGQMFYLLHYEGEGHWRVWFSGQITTVEMAPREMPRARSTWWARVKTASGTIGWVIATGNFDGQDILG